MATDFSILDRGLDVLTFAVVCIHVLLCPYTKVEESFNTQAVHDITRFGIQPSELQHYDHFEYPGVVPRTFVAPVALSIILTPIFKLVSFNYHIHCMRFVIGFVSVVCLGRFRRAFVTRMAPPSSYRCWSIVFTLLTCCQSHLPFYLSRPLANTFALCLTNLALAKWMMDSGGWCVSLLAFACAIFRADVVLFAIPLLLQKLLLGSMRWSSVIKWGMISSILAVSLTVTIDSYFWNQAGKWPELEVFGYNVPTLSKKSQSMKWGTQPFHWYFTSAIPRALLCATLFVPVALLQAVPTLELIAKHITSPATLFQMNARVLALILPPMAFVTLYSFLPHKELRFIFPALPMFNAIATIPLSRYLAPFIEGPNTKKSKTSAHSSSCGGGYIEAICAVMCLAASGFVTGVFTYASSLNYPGGYALAKVHNHFGCPPLNTAINRKLSVHVGNIAAINGVTRFGERTDCYIYSKKENLSRIDLTEFDIVLSEYESLEEDGFQLLLREEAFDRIDFGGMKITQKTKIFIHAKQGLSQLTIAS